MGLNFICHGEQSMYPIFVYNLTSFQIQNNLCETNRNQVFWNYDIKENFEL